MQWYKALVISQTLLHGLNLNKIPNFLFRFYFIVHEYFALFVRNCTSTKSCQCECVDYGFYEICKEAIMCFCLDLRLRCKYWNLARKWPTWKWTWIWIPYGKIAKKCPRYFRRDSRGNPRDLNMCRTGRSAALSRGRKSMPPIRVPMRMSRDYLYDFTLIFRWSTFSSTVNLCNINCIICSDTHSSFGPPIVAQSMSCEGVHDHENGVSKLT